MLCFVISFSDSARAVCLFAVWRSRASSMLPLLKRVALIYSLVCSPLHGQSCGFFTPTAKRQVNSEGTVDRAAARPSC